MSWPAVRSWRDAIGSHRFTADTGLSPEGLQLVLDHAIGALSDDALHQVQAMPGEPFDRAAFVAARTVVTAPIEWCAVLLGRGTEVLLKHPAGEPGLAPELARLARAAGLPLTISDRHDAAEGHPLVIAMGSDATIAALRQAHPNVLGFGHRTSFAWWGDGDEADALAMDLAAHDGRGCMSPTVVFSDQADAAARLASALARAEDRWPRGRCAPAELAAIRERRALSLVLGRVTEGAAWSVHELPADRARPVAMPRSVVVVRSTAEQARATMAPWRQVISTVAVTGDLAQWRAWCPAARACRPGAMQRPPLVRRHDGVDALAAMLR